MKIKKKTQELRSFKSSLREGLKYSRGQKSKTKVETIQITISKRMKKKGLKPKDVEKAIEDLRRNG